MEVTIFVYSYRFVCANTYYGFRLVFQVHADTTIFSFHIDEGDVMFRSHRVSYTAYFYLDTAIVQSGNYRNMLFVAGIDGIRNQLFHFFATTYYRNFAVYYLFNYITTMVALIKFCCHNLSF